MNKIFKYVTNLEACVNNFVGVIDKTLVSVIGSYVISGSLPTVAYMLVQLLIFV